MSRRSAMAAMLCGAALLVAPPAVYALDPCTQNCARIEVGSVSGAPNSTVSIPLSFTQGPADAQSGQGIDEIAAIALTIGIPGTGAEGPLSLSSCSDTDANGLPDAVTVAAAIRDTFRVVVENTDCTNRNRCLCPGEGQTRDDFINIVVYGPKDLPATGPVDIPVLPSGELLTIALRVGAASAREIPLHVFAETDDPLQTPKPQFGAFLSLGDKAAIDQTADRAADLSRVTVRNGVISLPAGGCVGDCDNSGGVTVDELVRGVNIALGNAPLSQCPSFDRNTDSLVTVDELVSGVNNALNGCP